MRNSYVDDDFSGFDHNSNVYDEKKERSYHARIWWALAIIGVGVFISLIVRQYKDYEITKTYNCIKASVYEGKEDHVVYTLDNGKERLYHLPSYPVKKDGKYVLLYYKDDRAYVKTIPAFKHWLPYYLFFIAMSGLSIYKLYRIYNEYIVSIINKLKGTVA